MAARKLAQRARLGGQGSAGGAWAPRGGTRGTRETREVRATRAAQWQGSGWQCGFGAGLRLSRAPPGEKTAAPLSRPLWRRRAHERRRPSKRAARARRARINAAGPSKERGGCFFSARLEYVANRGRRFCARRRARARGGRAPPLGRRLCARARARGGFPRRRCGARFGGGRGGCARRWGVGIYEGNRCWRRRTPVELFGTRHTRLASGCCGARRLSQCSRTEGVR